MASQESKPDPKHNPETAPDPDEDDLDDLDDMLDEFSAAKISEEASKSSKPTSAPSTSGPGRPSDVPPSQPQPTNRSSTAAKAEDVEDDEDADFDPDDFARQLQQGMADMLKDLEQNPDMAKQFEEMMAQFGAPVPGGGAAKAAGSADSSAKASSAPKPAAAGEGAFQDTIKRTMDRMKASSESASAAAANSGDDDIMMNLLKEMQSAGGGEGGEGDDAFSKMLLGMMEQLTNKEILYEPMKELDTKFDPWLAEHSTGAKKGSITAEDEKRYREQRQVVKEIVARFEKPGYSDNNAEDREYIVERMQKMQAAGAPPSELVGDMNAAQDMFGDLDAGCPQQ